MIIIENEFHLLYKSSDSFPKRKESNFLNTVENGYQLLGLKTR